MNPSEKEPPITREMHFETFFPLFISTYLTREKLGAYIAQHQSSLDYPTLFEFFQREPVKKLLERCWNSERDAHRFPYSTMKKVMEQTVDDTLSIVKGLITDHTEGKKTMFKNQPMEKVRQTQKIIFFYEGYFRQEFLGENPHLVP
jgi:hypothetical protein